MFNNMICKICNKETNNKYFCSRNCAGLNMSTNNNKLYPNKKIKRERISIKCNWDDCDNKIEIIENKKLRFCSNTCHIKWENKYNRLCEKGGNITKKLGFSNSRSKNEIYFSELCKKEFKNVKTNEKLFNGWDADVIIEDLKIAILWNGIWHYEKVTKTHSLKQVQTRDKIKIEEIKKMNYIPYVIKDMGRYNIIFVENEFQKFKKKFNY